MSEATATTTASDGGSIGPRVPGLDGDGSIGDPGSLAQGPLGPWVPGPGSIGTLGPRPKGGGTPLGDPPPPKKELYLMGRGVPKSRKLIEMGLFRQIYCDFC